MPGEQAIEGLRKARAGKKESNRMLKQLKEENDDGRILF